METTNSFSDYSVNPPTIKQHQTQFVVIERRNAHGIQSAHDWSMGSRE
jgi:hypothetical protein